MYANKGGAKILTKRFDVQYKGIRKQISTLYDLAHESSKDMIDKIINEAGDSATCEEECHIGILQNLTYEDENDAHRQDVGSLIVNDKLVYYKSKAFTGSWKTGN